MAAKVSRIANQDGEHLGFTFYCPGCRGWHMYYTQPWVKNVETGAAGPVWTFNGDLENPTFGPSLLIYEGRHPNGDLGHPRCHLFVRAGKIQYCGDCGHDLAGQIVDMIDVERAP